MKNSDEKIDWNLESTLEVERHVLGMIMNEAENYGRIMIMGARVDDFVMPEHQRIFATIADADVGNRPFDFHALATALPDLASYILRITDNTPITQNFDHYAREVIELGTQRRIVGLLVDAYGRLTRRAPFTAIADHIAAVSGALDAVTGPRNRSPMKTMHEVVGDVLRIIEERADGEKKGERKQIATNLPSIDRILGGGWRPGRFYVVAARPGVGKTLFGMHAAREGAEQGRHIAVFTLEMPSEELGERSIAAESRVSASRLAMGDLTDDEISRLFVAADRLHKLPITFNDSFRGDFDTMILEARRLHRQGRLDLMVVDYLQLLRLRGRFDGRVAELTVMTARLKLFAIEFKIPLVVLCGINREATKMDDRVGPGLQHLRDSGSIEADADTVIILHRPIDNEDPDTDVKLQFGFPKNRGGATGKITISVDLTIGKFREV